MLCLFTFKASWSQNVWNVWRTRSENTWPKAKRAYGWCRKHVLYWHTCTRHSCRTWRGSCRMTDTYGPIYHNEGNRSRHLVVEGLPRKQERLGLIPGQTSHRVASSDWYWRAASRRSLWGVWFWAKSYQWPPPQGQTLEPPLYEMGITEWFVFAF